MNRSGSISVGLPSRLRRTSQYDQTAHRDRAERPAARRRTRRPPARPGCRARCRPSPRPRAPRRRRRLPRGPVYGTSRTSLMPERTTTITRSSSRKRDPPRQVGGDEAAEQRSDRGGDRRRGADQRVGLLLRGAFEVAVDQRLHRGQQQRRAEPADDRPEDDDRGQALGEGHRQRADRVAEQAQHVRPLAADQVADLAADQDERGRHERLERDRRLHAADRRVQIVNHRRDRHVHQRRVDDEHEHRHREQDREPSRAPSLVVVRGSIAHRYSGVRTGVRPRTQSAPVCSRNASIAASSVGKKCAGSSGPIS